MIPWTVTCQAPLSMEFTRQDYWSRLPHLTSGNLSRPRDQTSISCVFFICRQILYHCTTWEAPRWERFPSLWMHFVAPADLIPSVQFSQFSRSAVSDSLRPHESQHARPPCPSTTPGVHLDSCPSSQWCHPAISSSVVPSPPALNPSQHHSLFQWVNSSHEVAKVLEFQL